MTREDTLVKAVQSARRKRDATTKELAEARATRMRLKARRVAGANISLARIAAYTVKVRLLDGRLDGLERSVKRAEAKLTKYRARNVSGPDRRGAALIAEFEGCYLRPYLDPVGFCTAGIGHLVRRDPCTAEDIRRWTLPSKEAAYDLLLKDLREDYTPQVMRALKQSRVPVTQGMVNASVSLAYNVGVGGFASSTVVKELRRGDKSAAARAFRLWNRAGGQVLAGLTRRREAEIKEFMR